MKRLFLTRKSIEVAVENGMTYKKWNKTEAKKKRKEAKEKKKLEKAKQVDSFNKPHPKKKAAKKGVVKKAIDFLSLMVSWCV